jgi:cytochrome c oxidase subunit 3
MSELEFKSALEPDGTDLAEQFEDRHQQEEAATLGMWTFLSTEILFFGGLILGYAVYRHVYFNAWVEGSHRLYESLGGINTAVLLCSSLSMALAVRAARLGQKKSVLITLLIITMVLGFCFLGIKGTEYYLEWTEHLWPGSWFHPEHVPANVNPRNLQLFMVFYFFMTGLHAIHMSIGIALVGGLAVNARYGRFSEKYYAPVEIIGLYWHFVDIVWIFLFPLLYLIK